LKFSDLTLLLLHCCAFLWCQWHEIAPVASCYCGRDTNYCKISYLSRSYIAAIFYIYCLLQQWIFLVVHAVALTILFIALFSCCSRYSCSAL